MKAVFVSFNQALYEAIHAEMDHTNIRGFTYWSEIRGRGTKTGEPHYGSHAWPTLNSAILTMIEDDKVAPFLNFLDKLNKQSEQQGLRAFVWDIEKSI